MFTSMTSKFRHVTYLINILAAVVKNRGVVFSRAFTKSLQRAKKRASCRFQVCEADVKVKALAAVGLTELD